MMTAPRRASIRSPISSSDGVPRVMSTDGQGSWGWLGGNMVRHSGGCHCGRVRFEVTAPSRFSVLECNCSMCSKSGYLHLIVPKARFRLLQGEESLTTYTFNTQVAKHFFCSV